MSIPLSLYIHIPWCVQKCPYCDFNSHGINDLTPGQLPQHDYIQRLLEDLDADIARFDECRPLQSIFIGGGTPSLIDGGLINQLLSGVHQRLCITEDTEITLEANPGTVDEKHFADYYRAGVNRISIGVQSFNPRHLQRLGRIHNPDDAVRAVKTAQDAGFSRLNIDLMFGLPQQTLSQALADIEQGIALQTEHLSYYQLTLEPNTAFAHNPPRLPDDEIIEQQFEQAVTQLTQAGFHRYEVSAWHRGQPSMHNLNYWQYGDYLGIGAGAHGKITTINQQHQAIIVRTTKPRSPKQYLGNASHLNSIPIQVMAHHQSTPAHFRQERIVTEQDKPFEFMLNALRLMHGFKRHWLIHRGLVNETTVLPTIQQLVDKGLLTISPDCIIPTELGQRFVNDMVSAFLAEQ